MGCGICDGTCGCGDKLARLETEIAKAKARLSRPMPQYANYSEALEQQLALYQRWGNAPLSQEFVGYTARRLRFAETYHVCKEVMPLLEAGAEGLPTRLQMTDAFPPSQNGFVKFEDPPTVLINDWAPARLVAVQWFRDAIGRKNPADGNRDGYALMSYVERTVDGMAGVRVVVPAFWTSWFVGETFALSRSREDALRQSNITSCDATTLDRQVRIWASFCLFVQQRILAYGSRVAERHTRKRVERANWQHQPVIRVVELRRKERIGEKQPVEPVEREWSCQWVVRGHWRQQFYPSKHANQPIWITPYVKGPDDKPLKPPRATVFAVVR